VVLAAVVARAACARIVRHLAVANPKDFVAIRGPPTDLELVAVAADPWRRCGAQDPPPESSPAADSGCKSRRKEVSDRGVLVSAAGSEPTQQRRVAPEAVDRGSAGGVCPTCGGELGPTAAPKACADLLLP